VVPVPLRPNSAGIGEFELIVKMDDSAPTVLGANCTRRVQLWPMGSVPMHLFSEAGTWKSPEMVDAPEMESGSPPQLVIVSMIVAVVPSGTPPNAKPVFGVTQRAGFGTVGSTTAT